MSSHPPAAAAADLETGLSEPTFSIALPSIRSTISVRHQHQSVNATKHVDNTLRVDETLFLSSTDHLLAPRLTIPSSPPPVVHPAINPSTHPITIPNKHKTSRSIRFALWFNTYRKLYTFILTLNTTGLLLASLNKWSYPRTYTGSLVLGNLLVAILIRNELFGRLLYLIVNTLFSKWTPLRFRLACTSTLQHLGGIHSGCATSAFIWLIFRLALLAVSIAAGTAGGSGSGSGSGTTDNPKRLPRPLLDLDATVLAFGILTNLALAISIISALPWVRSAHHNVFERHHRFVGWLALLFTWIFVVLGDIYTYDYTYDSPPITTTAIAITTPATTHSRTWSTATTMFTAPARGYYIAHQQDFWFVLCMTIFISIPWFTIRSVPVSIEIPSPKIAILRFDRGMQQGVLGRLSRTALLEYHAFGIVSEGKTAEHHYMICGAQGDFTRWIIEERPLRIWTRQLKFAGVSNTSTLYKRGIRVCTGTGLGSALSTCIQNPDWYLIWIASDQENTFGPTIFKLIRENIGPERMIIWDSKKRGGRPDVMELVKDAYVSWNAEVVFVTSNFEGNREIMRGCRQLGIPAFGTLWDF